MALLYKTLTIAEIREEVEDAKSFYFEEDASTIPWQPGQYLTLVLPDVAPEVRRSYSIITTPVLQEPLAIGVKRITNGIFSRWLIDHAKAGDKVQTIGAGGFFTLPENIQDYRQLFFFSAGSGITPALSLIKTALFAYPHLQVVLIYSNRSIETTLYRKELLQLLEKYSDRFRIEFLNSDNPNLSRARLHRDLLVKLMGEYMQAKPEEVLAFLCGPETYMRMCVYGLREVGVPFENIRKEAFTSDKQIPRIEPPDVEPHTVTVQLGNRTYSFITQYPETVLQAAKREGIILPYSCEAGRCGSCVARCLEGKLWMSYNEVLTEKETAQGLVLTCVAHPIGGDITLDIY